MMRWLCIVVFALCGWLAAVASAVDSPGAASSPDAADQVSLDSFAPDDGDPCRDPGIDVWLGRSAPVRVAMAAAAAVPRYNHTHLNPPARAPPKLHRC